MLKIGDKLPSFSCLDDKGNTVTQDNFKGKKVVLFFYPRANTPGCTAQACNLSENYDRLTDAGYTIFGVSADQVKHQASFSKQWQSAFRTHKTSGNKVCPLSYKRREGLHLPARQLGGPANLG